MKPKMITAKMIIKIKLLERFSDTPPCGELDCGSGALPSPKTERSSPATDSNLVLLQILALNESSPYAYTKYFSPSLNPYPQSLSPMPVETTIVLSEIPFQIFSISNFTLYPYPVKSRSISVTIPEKTADDFSSISCGEPGCMHEQARAAGTAANNEKDRSEITLVIMKICLLIFIPSMMVLIKNFSFLLFVKKVRILTKTEGERFELSVGCPTQTFQVCALDRYANPPTDKMDYGRKWPKNKAPLILPRGAH